MIVTAKQVQILQKGIQQGSWLYAHPFVWDETTQCFQVSQSKWQLAGCCFSTVFSLSYCSLLLYHFIAIFLDASSTISDKIFIGTLTIVEPLAVFIQVGFYIHANKIPRFFHQYVRHYGEISGQITEVEHKRREHAWAKRCEVFLSSLYVVFWTDWIQFTLLGIVLPRLPHVVSSSFLTESSTIGELVGWIVLSTAFFSYYMAVYVTNGTVIVGLVFPFYFSTVQTLRSMRIWDTSSQRLLQEYKELQLLLREYNITFGVSMGAVKAVFMVMVNGCIYGALRFDGVLASTLLLVGVSCSVITLCLVNLWGKIHAESLETLGAMKRCCRAEAAGGESAIFRRGVRSLRPMQIQMYGCYAIEAGTVLVVAKIILDNIVFVLVNF